MPICQTTPSATATPKRRGNPDLGLAPRCGARTRSGCPCLAPAIRGKTRCRMHGGRSTGPRTAAGLARMRAARTIHGLYGAEGRARDRHIVSLLRCWRITNDALRHIDRMPPELAARLVTNPPELSPALVRGGLSLAEHRVLVRAEAEALAPWRRAIAAARQAKREAAAGAAAAASQNRQAEPHAPEAPPTADTASRIRQAEPHAPVARRYFSLRQYLLASTSHTRHPPPLQHNAPPAPSAVPNTHRLRYDPHVTVSSRSRS
jgi:hypothetical protein